MTKEELMAHLDSSTESLKDFQLASVEALHHGLFEQGRPRMLLADEVGLGKTVVAKGLIAELLRQRIASGKRSPLRVTYICSNQVIARENVRKLDPLPSGLAKRSPVSRISYLAKAEEELSEGQVRSPLELNTLTPSTSFHIGASTGNRSERRIIYAALCGDRKMKNRKKGLQWLLKGHVKHFERFRRDLEDSLNMDLREDLTERFIKRIQKERIPLDVSQVYELLPSSSPLSLYEATLLFAEQLDGRSQNRLWNGTYYLIRALRRCLIECCLTYVKADLYILDEFQRFRELIDEDYEDEQAQIARIVFASKKKTPILLLSATPFKAFTSYHEAEQGEDHYKDFTRVLRFLLCNDEEQLGEYEAHRKALYRQILDLRAGDVSALSNEHRQRVESILRSVICRTERHSVVSGSQSLIEDTWKSREHQLTISPSDIENFRETDRISQALQRIGFPVGKPVEYCKSALHPLSFLDRYKLKELLEANQDHPGVNPTLLASKNGWLNLRAIDSYRWTPCQEKEGPAHARLKMLVDHAVGEQGAKLLWVPPSLPYYPLEDAFTDSEGFSKTLVFSSWVMVPRMIASLVSYEVERRTIGHPDSKLPQESEERTYFTPEGKRRYPVPQIRYARRKVKGEVQLTNMSNFTLLYPSLALVGLVDPLQNLQAGLSLGELRQQLASQIRELITRENWTQWETSEGESERWYWAAPLLLDRNLTSDFPKITSWLVAWNSERWEEENEELSAAKQQHFEKLALCLAQPQEIGLGRIPGDLPEALADLALGSPAVLALRSLQRIFPNESLSSQLDSATWIAHEFSNLFNKPESIAAVRLSETHGNYWRMVLDYCASGCLQSVLDEYFHLQKDQNVDGGEAADRLYESINLNASVINVDSLETFLAGNSQRFRCHYAVEFGSQRIESDSGGNRATSIRSVFNSPFRPFVLATTSIGQEGLDFHSYCRRIVHWNLPGNPVDLEQREGRINRYKSLVIRQRVARCYAPHLTSSNENKTGDPWETLFEKADEIERQETGKSELIPYWHVQGAEEIKIERLIPLYPFSADHSRLQHILKTLAIYRLAFGQPRQAELVDHLLKRNLTEEELSQIWDALSINLSPMKNG